MHPAAMASLAVKCFPFFGQVDKERVLFALAFLGHQMDAGIIAFGYVACFNHFALAMVIKRRLRLAIRH